MHGLYLRGSEGATLHGSTACSDDVELTSRLVQSNGRCDTDGLWWVYPTFSLSQNAVNHSGSLSCTNSLTKLGFGGQTHVICRVLTPRRVHRRYWTLRLHGLQNFQGRSFGSGTQFPNFRVVDGEWDLNSPKNDEIHQEVWGFKAKKTVSSGAFLIKCSDDSTQAWTLAID